METNYHTGTNQDQYFATLVGKELARELHARKERFFNSRSGLEAIWRRNNRMYYNMHDMDLVSGMGSTGIRGITRDGDEDEITRVRINQYRNFLQNMLVMITNVRPNFQCTASNNDAQSMSATKAATNIIEYYNREKDMGEVLKLATEEALVYGASYVGCFWDVSKGREFSVNPYDQRPVREGDLDYSNISVWDIVVDPFRKRFRDNDWIMIRGYRSKWALIAQYPELAEDLKRVPTVTEDANSLRSEMTSTEDVEVYEFFHKKTASMPNGKYALITGDDLVLLEDALPYEDIPVHCITAGTQLSNQFGYTIGNDLAPLQELYNEMWSSIVTVTENMSKPIIFSPADADIDIETIQGMNIVEFQGQQTPTSAILGQVSPDLTNMMGVIEKTMETLSGVNSVVRGNPDSSIKAASAMALIQNQALAFANHLQSSYIRLIEDVGTTSIRVLKKFALNERVITIVGKHNRAQMDAFMGSDLEVIDRVLVDLGNPAAQQLAGRIQLAQDLIQNGMITTKEEYLAVTETGRLDALTEHDSSSILFIRQENEDLLAGKGARAFPYDDHRLHILEHMTIANDPEFRSDQQKVAMLLSHIQEHETWMKDPSSSPIQGVLGRATLPADPQPQMGAPAQPPGGAPDMTNSGGQVMVAPQGAPTNIPPVQQAQPALPPPNAQPRV